MKNRTLWLALYGLWALGCSSHEEVSMSPETSRPSAKRSVVGSLARHASHKTASFIPGCLLQSGTSRGSECPGLSLQANVHFLAGGDPDPATDGKASEARFNAPRYLTSDKTTVYVSDYHSGLIRSVRLSDGETSTLAGGGLNGTFCSGTNAEVCRDGIGAEAEFNTPSGIAIIGDNLFIADSGNHRIRKLNRRTRQVETVAGNGNNKSIDHANGLHASFSNLEGLTTNGAFLYFVDGNRIRKMDLGGMHAVSLVAGSEESGAQNGEGSQATFDDPRGITTDGTFLYVSGSHSDLIRKINLQTLQVSTLAGGGWGPGVPCLGNPAQSCKDGAGSSAQFDGPRSITTDGRFLYVADSGNQRIRKIQISDGWVSTLVGNGGTIWSGDGTGTTVSLNGPAGLTTDGTSLYVGTVLNGSRILRVE